MYLVVGLGRTGIAVANYFKANNIAFLCNEASGSVPSEFKANFVQSPNEIDVKNIDHKKIDALILSPGISSVYNVTNEFVVYAKEQNIPIISDIDLFQKFFPEKKYVGITGTNGKSTTATLVFEILKASGKNVALCGNIGISPFANAVDAEICVFEISSFQLEITNVTFEIAGIINITPDHLERYGTLENYAAEKLKIVKQAKIAIVNCEIKCDGQNVLTFSHEKNADYEIIANEIYFKGQRICDFPKMKLLGSHNRQNVLLGFAVCKQFGINLAAILKTIENFNAIEHRIEFAGNLNGVTFYNDSKATNSDSTLNALQAMKEPTFLIAGGKLAENISGLFENSAFGVVKMIAVVGSGAGVIAKELQNYNSKNSGKQIKYCISGNIEKALKDLYPHAAKTKPSAILLSPFCKSFDQFKSFEERGQLFKRHVKQLIEKGDDVDI